MQNGIKQQPSHKPKRTIAPADTHVIVPVSARVRVTTAALQCWHVKEAGCFEKTFLLEAIVVTVVEAWTPPGFVVIRIPPLDAGGTGGGGGGDTCTPVLNPVPVVGAYTLGLTYESFMIAVNLIKLMAKICLEMLHVTLHSNFTCFAWKEYASAPKPNSKLNSQH